MKTLTWQKPGQQNVAQELIKIIINYVAELRFIIFAVEIYIIHKGKDMEKNKPISVAFEDIRNNPDFIEHSEYRFINDDLGMVISFQAMGFRLFRTQQPYRAKEGRIVRIMQGKGRISINLIEYEATAHDIIIILTIR